MCFIEAPLKKKVHVIMPMSRKEKPWGGWGNKDSHRVIRKVRNPEDRCKVCKKGSEVGKKHGI